ncbi:MAG TPA: substrate-binding domain-containing protein [Longimicrobiales bacterium]|nr:substrate-binding domain-containing protein [Longimicrobiales bacterium]
MRRLSVPLALLLAVVTACGTAPARLVLGTTHTVEDSGLLETLTASFNSAATGHRLSVVVAGSGEILTLARNGDLDVLLTHSPDDESAFIAAAHGESRQPVMHNDFVIVGPVLDPARVAAAADAPAGLLAIERARAPFVSRGDDSGTHRMERSLWAHAHELPDWPGYVEAGVGMADALRLAQQRRAYLLSDRATYERLRAELPELRIVHEGDRRLRNQYSVIVVHAARNADGARAFAEWIRSAAAQELILRHGTDAQGRPLFTPDAR